MTPKRNGAVDPIQRPLGPHGARLVLRHRPPPRPSSRWSARLVLDLLLVCLVLLVVWILWQAAGRGS
jgi:hypothetical protein